MTNQENSKKNPNQDNKSSIKTEQSNQKKGTETASVPDQPLADMNE